ncbi:hypothetical protein FE772_05395 [Lysobacter enzymogenes]|nr:hypothetical protein [Lysobacter enzymogenes]QCW25178.1 hypothetical protein FE772_05395 [Lysobacter enzymogenes]
MVAGGLGVRRVGDGSLDGARQWRFQRGLAQARLRADGLLQAPHRAGLPAAFGLLRPRIAVPAVSTAPTASASAA